MSALLIDSDVEGSALSSGTVELARRHRSSDHRMAVCEEYEADAVKREGSLANSSD